MKQRMARRAHIAALNPCKHHPVATFNDTLFARAGGTQRMLDMKYFVAVALAVFLSAPAFVAAQDISSGDTIVVTATRTEIPIDDSTVPVTVISREDIELSVATDLSELLRFEAGIDIGRNGGPGQATSVFLRGTESNHTLVLIDGV
ncbi:MAG: TonB-dependent receptor plug domain-containing protein, partial [Gammaproteobacteria bacterium]|nr:TonB-dependent receptor plug domain-containing protein [Gammaproteobacteria bacterium]